MMGACTTVASKGWIHAAGPVWPAYVPVRFHVSPTTFGTGGAAAGAGVGPVDTIDGWLSQAANTSASSGTITIGACLVMSAPQYFLLDLIPSWNPRDSVRFDACLVWR